MATQNCEFTISNEDGEHEPRRAGIIYPVRLSDKTVVEITQPLREDSPRPHLVSLDNLGRQALQSAAELGVAA